MWQLNRRQNAEKFQSNISSQFKAILVHTLFWCHFNVIKTSKRESHLWLSWKHFPHGGCSCSLQFQQFQQMAWVLLQFSHEQWFYMFPQFISWHDFRRFYRTQAYLGSDLWVRFSETHRTCADLTDVTLADEDINSILADNANRAIQGNVAMHVAPSGGQICN